METNKQALEHKQQHLESVSTLPIRNGNTFPNHASAKDSIVVSTLPIRNGNFNSNNSNNTNNGEYLTYKEWKRHHLLLLWRDCLYVREYLTLNKKDSSTISILLSFCIVYILFSFLILSTSSFIPLMSIPNPFSHLFSISLLFNSFISFSETEYL